MSLLSQLLQPRFSALLTSPQVRDLRRQSLELWRRLGDYPHIVVVWLRVNDPYACLLLQALADFQRDHAVTLQLRIVHDYSADTHPEPERLATFSRLDAYRLARHHGLWFPAPLANATNTPTAALCRACEQLLIRLEKAEGDWLASADTALRALWRNDTEQLQTLSLQTLSPPLSSADISRHLAQNQILQRSQGHYGSAMLHYAGEWYWALDRLPYLSQRLDTLGLRQGALASSTTAASTLKSATIAPTTGSTLASSSTQNSSQFQINDSAALAHIRQQKMRLDLYFSFRSPYSYLVLARTQALCAYYGIELQLRPVLPMVTRGMQVPSIKRLYIVLDAKREAEKLGMEFGRICDPLGRGVANCLALWHQADSENKGQVFSELAMRAIWSEGANMADKATAKRIARAARLSPTAIKTALSLPWSARLTGKPDAASWQHRVEQNRKALMATDLWGVPSMVLRYQDQRCVTWGQDRLWVIEQALADWLEASPISEKKA